MSEQNQNMHLRDFTQWSAAVSQILMDLLNNTPLAQVINGALRSVMDQFGGDRAYTFRINLDKQEQSCTYEVVSQGVNSVIDSLQNIPMAQTPWLIDHVFRKEPIILNSLEDLPSHAHNEYKLLATHGVKSMMMIPMFSINDEVKGYMGVDVVKNYRKWDEADKTWFKTIANTINICLELRHSQQNTRMEREYFLNLYNNMPIGYLRMRAMRDNEGKIVDYRCINANPTFNEHSGISGNVDNISISDCYADAVNTFDFNILAEIASGKQKNLITKILFHNNKYYSLTVYSDVVDQIIVLSMDITSQKESEAKLIQAKQRAEESDRFKTAFLANMSHEIRTPLNAIIGFSTLMADIEERDERHQYVSIIRKNNDMLLQLISDILDLSKIEAGMIELVNSNIEVNALCDSIIKSSKLRVSDGVDLQLVPHLPKIAISGDHNKLNQVLSNLITNALKFTQSGYVRVGYDLIDGTLRFYVEDTGCGMSKEQVERCFERFVKHNHTVGGSGLGLSICKGIIDKMGGEIGVDSQEHVGSRFWFSIPYTKEQFKQTTVDMKSRRTPMTINDKRPCVVIAEDNDSNYILISSLLRHDFDLFRAHNGLEAIELNKKYNPDIIIMDVNMPQMGGLEAIRRIREHGYKTPILALTAFVYETDRTSVISAGGNGFITKPINPFQFREQIRIFIKEYYGEEAKIVK